MDLNIVNWTSPRMISTLIITGSAPDSQRAKIRESNRELPEGRAPAFEITLPPCSLSFVTIEG